MVKNILTVGIISLSLIACTSSEPTPEKGEVKGDNKELNEGESEVNVIANRSMTMEVEGMVCQMGCGGSIRKELRATGAVADCEFDFEDERAVDIATIEFDKDKISADEIIKIVSEINDGQFTVGKTSTEALEKTEVKEDKTTSRVSSKPKVVATSSTFQLPNLFDLFSGLLSF